jgi:hypothetical protein
VSLSQKIGESRIWVIAFIAFIMGIGILSWIKIDQKRMSRQAESQSVDSKDAINLVTSAAMRGDMEKKSPFLLSESPMLHHAETKEWYANLYLELKCYLAAHFSMHVTQISQRTMGDLAEKGLMDKTAFFSLRSLMQDLEVVAYAPFEAQDRRKEFLDRCQEWVSYFEQTSDGTIS